MTPQLIAIYIGIGILIGFIITALVCLNIHERHKKAWRVEYRRLMGGISRARNDVVNISIHRATVSNNLDRIYNNKPILTRE